MKSLPPFIVCLGLLSCQNFAVEEKIVGKYSIVAADDPEFATVGIRDNNHSGYGTVIPAQVFAAGYDSNYIIVKQHSYVWPGPSDKLVTNYFILTIEDTMNWTARNGLVGPLNENEFKRKRRELGIADSVLFSVYVDW